MADERAETGRLSDAESICSGCKYGSLQLHMKSSLQAHIEEDKLPRSPSLVMTLPTNKFTPNHSFEPPMST